MAVYKTKGGYKADVYLYTDENGKKIRKTQAFKLQRDAKEWEAQILRDCKDGVTNLNGNMPLREYLNYWYDTYVMANTKYQTQKRYRTLIDCVIDQLGHLQLKGVKTAHVDRLYADLKQEMTTLKDGTVKRRYADGTILKVHRVFRQAMEKAIAWEMIARNPVSYAMTPKDDKRDIKTWTLKESYQFLSLIQGTVMYLPCFIVLHTGLRAGEVSALRWEDIDFDNNLLYVNKSAYEKTGEGTILGEPKTESSKDSVAMTSSLASELKRVAKNQKIHKLQHGVSTRFEYVCCWDDGRPLRPNYISTRFGALVEMHNMKKITFHGLRHTHASLLFELGESSHAISKRLRHSRVSTTDDIYIHLTEKAEKNTAQLFDQAVKQIN